MNVKYRQPLLLCQLISTSNDHIWRLLFQASVHYFLSSSWSAKRQDIQWITYIFVFFLLRLTNWAVHESEWYLFWRVKHGYLEWLIKLNFLPKYIENTGQVLITDWVLLQCTHGPTLWHANIPYQVRRTKAKQAFLDPPSTLYLFPNNVLGCVT